MMVSVIEHLIVPDDTKCLGWSAMGRASRVVAHDIPIGEQILASVTGKGNVDERFGVLANLNDRPKGLIFVKA